MSYFRTQLEDWLKTIDVKADKVLDVGGGALPVSKRVKSWDVKEYRILDNELEDMKQQPDFIWDLNQWIENSGKERTVENNDVVFCLEVMEYIWNPFTALNNLNYCLRKDGILYISFPFIYPHHNPKGADMLRYTRWGVEKLLNETGFEIVELTSRLEWKFADAGETNLASWFGQEGMHPAKGYAGHNEIGYLVKAIKK